MSDLLLQRMTVDELKNAIWKYNIGVCPVGGYPIEWYRDELENRTGSRKGYHED